MLLTTFFRAALWVVFIGLGPVSVSASTVEANPQELKLFGAFSNNAILQRDQPVPVWGWAKPGADISLSFAGQEKKATADASGKWRVVLDPMAASSLPRNLVLKSGEEVTECSDVLVGDVWFCSGQSNMALQIQRTNDLDEVKSNPENRLFRSFSFSVKSCPDERESVANVRWSNFAPGNVATAYATAYFFGKTIQKELGVPVGLIFGALGGTPIEAWMPRRAFAMDPDLEQIALKGLAANAEGLRQNNEYLTAGGEPTKLPWPQWRTDQTPTWLYNGVVHPFVGMAIKGFIWYQGEANLANVDAYAKLFPAQISAWREAWGRADLPFYFCQLPGLDVKGSNQISRMRLVQADVLRLPKTGMAVIYDTAEEQDLHPVNKRTVGERLALIALAKEYGKNIEYSGPSYLGYNVTGSKVTVKFSHTEGGLVAKEIPAEYHPIQRKPETKPVVRRSPGSQIEGFQLLGKEDQWVWSDAVISGNDVEVTSPSVSAPKGVRYACADFGFFNLFNRAGLPAGPFDSTRSNPPPP